GERTHTRDRVAQVARCQTPRYRLADPHGVGHALDVRWRVWHRLRISVCLDHQPADSAAGDHRALVRGPRDLHDRRRRTLLRTLSRHARRRAQPHRSTGPGVAVRGTLLREIVRMSWDTIQGNKLRSFLTVLGIVIGITSIVGMTAMIRGFDESIREVFRQLGPNTIYVQKMSFVSFG